MTTGTPANSGLPSQDNAPDAPSEELLADLLAIAARSAALVQKPYVPHGDELYDADGMPSSIASRYNQKQPEIVILDQHIFILDAEQHEQFLATLDAPLVPLPQLEKLMKRDPLWKR